MTFVALASISAPDAWTHAADADSPPGEPRPQAAGDAGNDARRPDGGPIGVGAGAGAGEAERRPKRDVTFIVTSDAHYDAFENEDRNARVRDTIKHMNDIAGVSWPAPLGGTPIGRPRGVIVLGDVIDDGDRLLEGKHQTPVQWAAFLADFGFDGTDGLLAYPVFETWGNHDGPPAGSEKLGFSFQAQLKKRNVLRKERGWLAGLSPNGLHYSWDWDDVHFVSVGIYPADQQNPKVKYNRVWHDPQGALAFLKEDLAARVGASGRPVVVMSHCGFDSDWWIPEDWKAAYDALKPYNVILYLYGHSGTGWRQWAPEGESKPLDCLNTGQTENGFFVVRIEDGGVRFAFRVKRWAREATAGARPSWSGAWEWRHELIRR